MPLALLHALNVKKKMFYKHNQECGCICSLDRKMRPRTLTAGHLHIPRLTAKGCAAQVPEVHEAMAAGRLLAAPMAVLLQEQYRQVARTTYLISSAHACLSHATLCMCALPAKCICLRLTCRYCLYSLREIGVTQQLFVGSTATEAATHEHCYGCDQSVV